ncbi:DUF262 domain-containing protein [Mycetocola zhadangensis]|uniref:DUF262 domain-containing protein n=1 Tax=Mycetocola zhadangensis TaxID=1164595 RepID=A0A3L7J5Y1_9MICO|nr:DUF262 domain-containing protein [Mycetocola zhadangensis]RLQ85869.1 DUF262 domain-containing protein [Mycetocola zhadangensis]GGE86535.1 hypothetical protein GCM10011313_06210 [Mycetocola zhadangensis]
MTPIDLSASTASNETNATEVDDADETDSVAPHVDPITYFGTEFDVHGLVRRFNQRAIVVPSFDPNSELPDERAQGFQRGVVWRPAQKQKFIESLLLGFPVPGIFLVEQPGKKYLVLDGQQRLTTLAAFYGDKFRLDSVDDKFVDKTYSTLADDVQRMLDDTFIQAIIIRTPTSVDEYESVYQIFERLNSGGTQLQPHEIRVALYGGKTVEAIRELNNDDNWRKLFGNRDPRLKDQELILRAIALNAESEQYSAPLKVFLNTFLGDHRNGEGLDLEGLSRQFTEAARILASSLGERPFRLGTRVNAAILESVFVAVMDFVASGAHVDLPDEWWKATYDTLLTNQAYLESVSKATANEDTVARRLALTRDAFRR